MKLIIMKAILYFIIPVALIVLIFSSLALIVSLASLGLGTLFAYLIPSMEFGMAAVFGGLVVVGAILAALFILVLNGPNFPSGKYVCEDCAENDDDGERQLADVEDDEDEYEEVNSGRPMSFPGRRRRKGKRRR